MATHQTNGPRTAVISGITGQDGSYLAELLLEKGYRVVGLVRPDSNRQYDRISAIYGRIVLVEASLTDQSRLDSVIEEYRPAEIYNLGARASSTQLVSEPVLTSEFNGLAVVRWLEAIRKIDPAIRFCQASSSEMFGNADASPQGETTAFRPRNPYGVAKLFAHGMVGSYRTHHGIFACSSILFNHESPRRGLEYVTRKISVGAARIAAGLDAELRLGSLDATRDWGYAADYVRGMWQMLQAAEPDDYVLATGISHSVGQFCEVAFGRVGLDYRRHVVQTPAALRPGEVVPLVGDPRKAQKTLNWRSTVSFEELVCMMVDADMRALRGRSAPVDDSQK